MRQRQEQSYSNYLVSIHITILFFFRLHSDWFDQVSAQKEYCYAVFFIAILIYIIKSNTFNIIFSKKVQKIKKQLLVSAKGKLRSTAKGKQMPSASVKSEASYKGKDLAHKC